MRSCETFLQISWSPGLPSCPPVPQEEISDGAASELEPFLQVRSGGWSTASTNPQSCRPFHRQRLPPKILPRRHPLPRDTRQPENSKRAHLRVPALTLRPPVPSRGGPPGLHFFWVWAPTFLLIFIMLLTCSFLCFFNCFYFLSFFWWREHFTVFVFVFVFFLIVFLHLFIFSS